MGTPCGESVLFPDEHGQLNPPAARSCRPAGVVGSYDRLDPGNHGSRSGCRPVRPPTEQPAEAASRRVRELQGKALAALAPSVQAAVDAQEQGSARWLTCAGMRPRHVASSTTSGAPTRSGSTGGARRRISRTCGSGTTLLVSPCSGTARPTSRDTCRPVPGSRIRPWRALGRAADCVSKTSVGCDVPAGPAVYGMSRSSVGCDVPAGPAVYEVYRRSVGGVARERAARRRLDAAGSNARPQRRPQPPRNVSRDAGLAISVGGAALGRAARQRPSADHLVSPVATQAPAGIARAYPLTAR